MSFFFNVVKGDPLFTEGGKRDQLLQPMPADGMIMVTDRYSANGFSAYTIAQLFGAAGGLPMLTVRGDIPVFDGSLTARLPVGPNGYVLTASSSSATGVEWAPPDTSGGPAGGDVDATPDTLVLRSSTGLIKSVGLETSSHIVPTTSGITVGSVGVPFTSAYATTVNTATVQSAAALTLSCADTYTTGFTIGGTTVLTLSSARMTSELPIVAKSSLIIGTYGASGSYLLKTEGGALVIAKWNGSAYVNYSVLA